MSMTPRQLHQVVFQTLVRTRAEMIELGWTPRRLTRAVRAGVLVRPRRDRYALADLDDSIIAAVRAGGALTCLSLLQLLRVFVLKTTSIHVRVAPNSSRHGERRKDGCALHWRVDEGDEPLLHVTSLSDAIRHSVRCQDARPALATLDSLVHHGLVTIDELTAIFATLPTRFRILLDLVDGTAASGPETYVRLMLRTLGLRYETQVWIEGVGYVDFVVEGWLIIECDSKEFHEGWAKQKQDRRRDLAAARLGFVTIRPLAADILTDGSTVQEDIRVVVAAFGRAGASA